MNNVFILFMLLTTGALAMDTEDSGRAKKTSSKSGFSSLYQNILGSQGKRTNIQTHDSCIVYNGTRVVQTLDGRLWKYVRASKTFEQASLSDAEELPVRDMGVKRSVVLFLHKSKILYLEHAKYLYTPNEWIKQLHDPSNSSDIVDGK